eukprot:TRINITY_DN75540_c0_g1_i1.p2 TRINITY_DN75540_c0_g1~~TRINITY_DN75540_c0_g1_i1.p2  ORF type:complete len:106 (-),score=37.10 TRINITY_DN75540_c0_g1_i1:114-431(-)
MPPPTIVAGDDFDISVGGMKNEVDGKSKWALGSFTLPETNGLRIAQIYDHGALADWNLLHGDREVKPGDLITEVNKRAGDGHALREELYKKRGQAVLKIRAGQNH